MRKFILRDAVLVLTILLLSCGAPSRHGSGQTAPLHPLTGDGITATLAKNEGQPLHNLEQIGSVVNPYSSQSVSISLASDVEIIGWAVDKTAKSGASGVELVIDGKPCKAKYGSDRGDVADFYKIPSYGKSGFAFVLPARSLAKGRHELAVRVLNKDEKSFNEGMTVTLIVN